MKNHQKSPVIRMRRSDIGCRRTMILYVQAGGRCEFRGCNRYLLKHSVTQTVDNYGEIAHIVAFSEGGPRGRICPRPKDPHDLGNLMLLCDECHKHVDRHPADYPVAVLRAYKQEHEENIYFATGIKRSQMTAIVRLEVPIDSKAVSIPLAQVDAAIAPRLRAEKPCCHIDLNELSPVGEPTLMGAAEETIDRDWPAGHIVLLAHGFKQSVNCPVSSQRNLQRDENQHLPIGINQAGTADPDCLRHI